MNRPSRRSRCQALGTTISSHHFRERRVAMNHRWLITGCSTGLGRALAQELGAMGELALITARNPAKLQDLAEQYADTLVTAPLDVRDPEQCRAVVELAKVRFGGLDVLVNNAGYGQFGVVEEVSDNELAAQFETNV